MTIYVEHTGPYDTSNPLVMFLEWNGVTTGEITDLWGETVSVLNRDTAMGLGPYRVSIPRSTHPVMRPAIRVIDTCCQHGILRWYPRSHPGVTDEPFYFFTPKWMLMGAVSGFLGFGLGALAEQFITITLGPSFLVTIFSLLGIIAIASGAFCLITFLIYLFYRALPTYLSNTPLPGTQQ